MYLEQFMCILSYLQQFICIYSNLCVFRAVYVYLEQLCASKTVYGIFDACRHWRYEQLAVAMLGVLIRTDLSFPASAVRVITHTITHDNLHVRAVSCTPSYTTTYTWLHVFIAAFWLFTAVYMCL